LPPGKRMSSGRFHHHLPDGWSRSLLRRLLRQQPLRHCSTIAGHLFT
jgi:hypothetical protein